MSASKPDFVHLHVHSEYSLLDGLTKIKDLAHKAKELGMSALALTDHGVMYGAIHFYNAMKEEGLKAIIGCEVYLAPRSRYKKDGKQDRKPSHMTLLAKNHTGYINLMKIVTDSFLEGFYYKPRVDEELLRQYHQGIICLSGCRGGLVTQYLINDHFDKAEKQILKLADIFGKDNVFIELQVFDVEKKGKMYEDSQKLKREGVRLSQKTGIPVVATNDIHYLEKEDAYAQEILLCVQTKETINNPQRGMSMVETPDFYFRTQEEMSELFADVPEALENTVKIAEKCNLEIKTGECLYPAYDIPEGETDKSYLRKLTEDGIREKFGKMTPELQEKIDYELEIISGKHYDTYFLICRDLALWSRAEGIPISTRGSVTASLVAYALEITNINPLLYNLPFERFLNPERPSPPDIDFDVAEDKRQEVIDYIYDKYGRDHVAQIITFGKMEARAAIRDVARVLDLPYSVGDRLAKMIPLGMKINEALEESVDLKNEYENDPEVRQVIDLSLKIEGVVRHASTHACGVLVSPEPLTNYVPLQRESKGGNNIITQYDMYSVDINAVGDKAIGLLKLDILGLKNLSILRQATEMIKKRSGEFIDIYKLDTDKKAVYDMLGQGHSTGVFQLESTGMRRLLKQMQPENFIDLAAAIALYRPGPMDLIPQYLEARKDRSKIKYPHSALKEILEETFGVLIFQEQCMAVVSKMGGYTQGRADVLRRAIGKKKKSLMMEEKKNFVKAAQEQGYSAKEATDVFSYIETFARYGFNKSHTSAYALIAYQTAYLKYYYPAEFLTALLSNEKNQDKIPMIIEECHRLGLEVCPPDVNRSFSSWSIEKDVNLRYGLKGIKNVGEGVIEKIIQERESAGPFRDLADLCRRVDHHSLNKRALDSFIRSGACDSFGNRASQLKVMENFLKMGSEYQKNHANGQTGLFEIADKKRPIMPPAKLPEGNEAETGILIQWERDLLGFNITPDPKDEQLKKFQNHASHFIGDLEEEKNNIKVHIFGLTGEVRRILTRKNNQEMAFMRLRDQTGSIEIVVFPKLFAKVKSLLQENALLEIKGKTNRRDEEDRLSILAEEIKNPAGPLLNQAEKDPEVEEEYSPRPPEDDFQIADAENSQKKVFCRLEEDTVHIGLMKKSRPEILKKLKQIIAQNPGEYELMLTLINGEKTPVPLKLPHKIDYSEELEKEILKVISG